MHRPVLSPADIDDEHHVCVSSSSRIVVPIETNGHVSWGRAQVGAFGHVAVDWRARVIGI
jgi:hypothetical protein